MKEKYVTFILIIVLAVVFAGGAASQASGFCKTDAGEPNQPQTTTTQSPTINPERPNQ